MIDINTLVTGSITTRIVIPTLKLKDRNFALG